MNSRMKTNSKYVKSERIYTSQSYCERMTGHCYGFHHENNENIIYIYKSKPMKAERELYENQL